MLNESQNSQIVHDAAAYLFWTLAEKIGIQNTNEAIIESSGRCLFKQQFSNSLLEQYNFEKLSYPVQLEFMDSIASEAESFAIRGVNMDGVIYAEDASSGRSPSALMVNTAELNITPKQINYDHNMTELGHLCLRHPLPAIVFSDTETDESVIKVANTSKALGFHFPLFLSNIHSIKINDGLFALTGIFLIPVKNNGIGGIWNKTIQNAITFVDEVKLFNTVSTVEEIKVSW
jgi:hypothetical protein